MATRVTPYYRRLFGSTDDCPIRRQALPHPDEVDPVLPSWAQEQSELIYGSPVPWRVDAIGDLTHLAAPRLTHRYSNRALLHLSAQCAVACRFCFRKTHLSTQERRLYSGTFAPALAYLHATPTVTELILTGGDPLSLPNQKLAPLLQALQGLPTLRIIRIHSRMPVTLPERINPGLIALLEPLTQLKTLYLVTHFNHPKELTDEADQALRRLRHAGVLILNQSVLLRGVNDQVSVLQKLWQGLYERAVVPLYLHHTDWTPGSFHFRVPIQTGLRLLAELRGRLSGPALPHYVVDLPGGGGKVPLHQAQLEQSWEDFPISGARYRMSRPATRLSEGTDTHFTEVPYLDLYLREQS